MLLHAPIHSPAQRLAFAEPVQPRRDSSDARAPFVRGTARRGSGEEPAAIVHFGTRALQLALGQAAAEPETGRDLERAEADGAEGVAGGDAGEADAGDAAPSAAPQAAGAAPARPGGAAAPSEAEQRELHDLRQRDREVRTHEQAHKAAGGGHTGSIRLTYQVGPDGKRYAVEGSVPIDVSPVRGDPEATLRKMELVQRAANAPASPSSEDRAVAAQARNVSQRARAQLAAERYARARDLAASG